MQITNTIYTTHQTKNVSMTQKTEAVSFASLLENEQNKNEQEEEKVGLYLKYMEQFNYFDSLSQEDRKVFREILKDDKITLEEMDSLTYEQVEKFESIAFPQGEFTKEQINNVPLVNMSNQISEMLFTTRTTNDKTFNQALFRTAREIDDDLDRRIILGEVKTNITQVHFGDPLVASFNVVAYENAKNLWQDDVDRMNIDYNKFFQDVINLHEEAISNPKTHPAVLNQHKKVLDGYNIILKHYNEIKNENSKYA